MPRQDMTIYNQLTFGIEIELTGNTRFRAAQVLARCFHRRDAEIQRIGTHYDKHEVKDTQGRTWTILRDSSITPLKKQNGRFVSASDLYRVELTSAVLKAEDIEMLQEVIRALRKAGFFASSSCGIHIHVGVSQFPVKTLTNLINIVASKQILIYQALGIPDNSPRLHYCKPIPEVLCKTIQTKKPQTLNELADIWYSTLDYGDYTRPSRYPSSRYYILNLTRGLVRNSQWYLGTAEFRCFQLRTGKLHAGEIKGYIQWCLLTVQYAAITSRTKYTPTVKEDGDSDKYRLRCYLLKIGAIGDEFKTLRKFWLDNFGTQCSSRRRGDTYRSQAVTHTEVDFDDDSDE